MTSRQDASLELREVQERFTASAAALEEVRVRADELSALVSRRESAAQSLEEASDQVRELARSADATVTALAAAQDVIVEAFAAVQSVMDGTELRELRASLEGIEDHFNAATAATVETVREGQERIAKQAADESAKLTSLLQEMAAKVDGAREADDERSALVKRIEALQEERDGAIARAVDADARFEKLKIAAGARAVRKAGLDSST